MPKKNIAFVYLDKPYVIYHSIGLAVKLSKKDGVKVTMECNWRNFIHIKKERIDTGNATVRVSGLPFLTRFIFPYWLESIIQFKLLIFLLYRKRFKQYDAIICSGYKDVWLRAISGTKAKLIYADHGLINRTYSFDNRIREFDLVFMRGEKEKRMRAQCGQGNINSLDVGFIKGAYCKNMSYETVFKNGAYTIIYNPHWDSNSGSFQKYGEELLDWFCRNKSINLIFSPHERFWHFNFNKKSFMQKYESFSNIFISVDDNRAFNMGFLKEADLYMGDISSMAWEFVYMKPRPCIFLNKYSSVQDNPDTPLSWVLGDVISGNVDWWHEIDLAGKRFLEKYHKIQQIEMGDMFFNPAENPFDSAALGLLNYLENQKTENLSIH